MTKNSSRIAWIDLCRCLAIMAVVLCHATEGVYSMNVNYLSSVSTISRLFALSAFALGRIGVPFFLFISGYFLLDRDYTTEKCKLFWKNKWIPLIITVEIWIVLYNLFLYINNGQSFDTMEVLKQMLFLKHVPMSHMWYMPMIIGMYLFIPFVANSLCKLDVKLLYLPSLIIFAYVFLVPIANIFINVHGRSPISPIFSMGFSGGSYGLYLLLGYSLKKGILQNVRIWTLKVLGLVSFCATVFLELYAYSHGISYNVWYDCGFLLICAMCFFECLSRQQKLYGVKVFSIFSKYSFAIYLIHNPIRLAILPYIKELNILMPLKVVSVWTICMFTSLLLAILLNKIPKIGKICLYMR